MDGDPPPQPSAPEKAELSVGVQHVTICCGDSTGAVWFLARAYAAAVAATAEKDQQLAHSPGGTRKYLREGV